MGQSSEAHGLNTLLPPQLIRDVPGVITHWTDRATNVEIYTVRIGEWEERLHVSLWELMKRRSQDWLLYQLIRVVNRVEEFHRLVREDRDW